MSYYPRIHVCSSHNSNNIWREIQIMKLFIMQFHSFSYYFQMQKSTYWTALFPYLVYSLYLKSHTKFHKPAWVNMHTFVSQGHVFKEQSKIIRSLLQIHFLSISWFCNLYFFLPLLNISEVPHPFKIRNIELSGFRLWLFFWKSSDQTLPYSLCALQNKLSTAV